jgi:hypothetical protein
MKKAFPSRDDAGHPSSDVVLKFGCAPGGAFSMRIAGIHSATEARCARISVAADWTSGATASFVLHATAAAIAASASRRDQSRPFHCIVIRLPLVGVMTSPHR